ncbi:helix-turn-helix domain-containing protein [Flectobacillus roseus]|uniref:helix-turn-helix domain-containing protein n=1 Tax=Flectobacillus roseus TaxID=502259 RepID=UPI001412179C|nr:helix-turn-helix transcriptional regulator [Flectobacillus roseus]MDI9872133.1 helix-turn-helix transcriptional regulator [Flectobacillus roseus]NBA77297.1 helix-turn-helix domain-containing protein [Emticicia sp. ODNR4P]
MSIGSRVKEIRGKMSQAEFGASLGVTSQNISSIEQGKVSLTTELALKICDTYNCSIEWLLRGSGDKAESPKVEEPATPDIGLMTKYMDLLEKHNKLLEERLVQKEERIREQETAPNKPLH